MTAKAAPEVAVVIPTHERETRLAFALEALAEQTIANDRFEVVVVRSGDPPEASAMAPRDLPVRFLVNAGPAGPAAQRNRGWRASRAPLIAFMDDDSRPAPDWLEQLLASDAGPGAIVQGRIEPDPDERHLLYGLARSHEIAGPSPRFETGNIAYPRALLERLGGFDESFRGGAWGEDTEIGVRAVQAGARPIYADRALVWHAVIPRTLADALRDAGRYESLVALLARYPDQRRRLFPRRVVKPTHATLPLALAGIAVLSRSRLLAGAALAPYAAGHLRRHLRTNPLSPRSVARFAVHLPVLAACELAELAVILRAAARHRVLMI